MIGGELFNSVEQYFSYCKAVEHGYAVLARKILRNDDPTVQKTLGERVKVNDSWESKREKVLYAGIYAKFTQNEELGRKLLSTGKRQLYEATTDQDYGCGIGLNSAKWAQKDWSGQNICGNILMRVRDELIGKIDMGNMLVVEGSDDESVTMEEDDNQPSTDSVSVATSEKQLWRTTPYWISPPNPYRFHQLTPKTAHKLVPTKRTSPIFRKRNPLQYLVGVDLRLEVG